MKRDLSNSVVVHCEKDGVQYLQFRRFQEYEVRFSHCFSTRIAGKDGELDLGLPRHGRPIEKVIENYRRICSAIGIDYRNLVFSNQVHEDVIRYVSEENRGEGIEKPICDSGYDGLITQSPKVGLVTLYADCVPVIFYDPVRNTIAASHAGWRGTVKRIAAKTVRMMCDSYGSSPGNIIACIGPSIGPCCFEVEENVADEFRSEFSFWPEIIHSHAGEAKKKIDLWMANFLQLVEAGVREDNICTAGLCTVCNNDIFFSYRADKGRKGSLAAIMQLK